jgi:hypothetical protein
MDCISENVDARPLITFELDELEEMLCEVSPIVLRKLRPAQDDDNPFSNAASDPTFKPVIDVARRLSTMCYMGGNDTAIHGTQVSVTASMLNAGFEIDEVVSHVLEATRAKAGDYGKRWNWTREERAIRGMCDTWLKKHPQDHLKADLPPGTKLILSSGEFVAGFVAPDYLLDGVLLRGFVYALTAPTGHGKTALALLLAVCVASGDEFAKRAVGKGRVLYFAGENPDDVRMRWIGMAEKLGFDVDTIDVSFVCGVYDISKIESRIHKEIDGIGGAVMVVIDTSPAYFAGDNENDNPQMIAHAQMLYRLRLLPGKPTVLAACHPVKNAGRDALIPRGGGGFLNAIDGNLTAWRGEDGVVTIGQQGKFRGIEFEPIRFELVTVNAAKLMDSKGRQIPTVAARALSKEDAGRKLATAQSDGDELLAKLYQLKDGPGINGPDLANALMWRTSDNEPHRMKVNRAIAGLNVNKKNLLVELGHVGYALTAKGRKAAETIARTGATVDRQPEPNGKDVLF